MAISNTYVEPTAVMALNSARIQFNDAMRALLTNFKSVGRPSTAQITIDGVQVGEQDGMLYRSATTNALYISDSVHKKGASIGGNFTRWGIGHRVEPSLAALTTNIGLYEIGELVGTLDTGKLYFRNSNTAAIGSFIDVGTTQGYSVDAGGSATFTGANTNVIRLFATSNVGIGTTTPTQTLDVQGTVAISGNTTISGANTTVTGILQGGTIYSTMVPYIGSSWTLTGPSLAVRPRTYTDSTSITDAVVATRPSVSVLQPTFNSLSSNVVVTDAATVYIQRAPLAGANTVITNPHALHVGGGRVFLDSTSSTTIPALAINTQNTGLFSATAGTIGIATNSATALTVDAVQNVAFNQSVAVSGSRLTVYGNVYTSNINFVSTSAIRGDFATTSGVTTTAAGDAIATGAYTPSPAGGNMKTLSNTGAFTFNAPTATGDYTMVVQITNSATAGAITFAGFTKTQGSSFTTTSTHKFLVYITKINSLTLANVVALQ